MFRKIVASLVMATSLFAFMPSQASAYVLVNNEWWHEILQGWNNLYYCFESSFPTSWRAAASEGMKEWNDIQGDPLDYLPWSGVPATCPPIGNFPSSHQVRIKYVDFGNPTCTLAAVTTVNIGPPHHTGAFISVNNQCSWSGWNWGTDVPLTSEYDGWSLITHEAGHAGGLGHYGCPGSIMCSAPKLGGHRYIELDSVNGMNAMYP